MIYQETEWDNGNLKYGHKKNQSVFEQIGFIVLSLLKTHYNVSIANIRKLNKLIGNIIALLHLHLVADTNHPKGI